MRISTGICDLWIIIIIIFLLIFCAFSNGSLGQVTMPESVKLFILSYLPSPFSDTASLYVRLCGEKLLYNGEHKTNNFYVMSVNQAFCSFAKSNTRNIKKVTFLLIGFKICWK